MREFRDLRTPQQGSADLLRSVFRQHAAGVAVITAMGERPVGLTAASLCSVALEPSMVSFNIGTRSSCWPVISRADHVVVHLLGEHQQGLADTFARRGADRFAEHTHWTAGPRGIPVLDGVLAWLLCGVTARIPAGDHRLILANVLLGDHSGAGRPLIYHQGRYNALKY
jgi:flavin reductase (DIM6/NTAB) family NADH-FMN oxidoreductase RutF